MNDEGKTLFVLVDVKHGKGGTSSLTFFYDELVNGLCKNARSPENLTGKVLEDAIRFTNHIIVSSYGSFAGKYKLAQNVFKTFDAEHQTISEFSKLLKESMKKGQVLEYVSLRWNVK